MSDDAIHNPSAATNEQTETTKEIVEQRKVTESPAATTLQRRQCLDRNQPPAETTPRTRCKNAGERAARTHGQTDERRCAREC